jgi:hypothetical protein
MAEYLELMIPQVASPAHWEQLFQRRVIQPIERWAVECQQLYGEQPEWGEWWQRFAQMLPAVLEGAARHVAAAQQTTSDEVRAQLQLAGYAQREAPLSRMAVNLLLHLEGVASVLVGMRHPEYVADCFAAADLPAVDSLSILRRFAQMNPQASSHIAQ